MGTMNPQFTWSFFFGQNWIQYTGSWYTYPSEKYEFVSWDDDIPNIWKVIKFMFQTTSPVMVHLWSLLWLYYLPPIRYMLNLSREDLKFQWLTVHGWTFHSACTRLNFRQQQVGPDLQGSSQYSNDNSARKHFLCQFTTWTIIQFDIQEKEAIPTDLSLEKICTLFHPIKHWLVDRYIVFCLEYPQIYHRLWLWLTIDQREYACPCGSSPHFLAERCWKETYSKPPNKKLPIIIIIIIIVFPIFPYVSHSGSYFPRYVSNMDPHLSCDSAATCRPQTTAGRSRQRGPGDWASAFCRDEGSNQSRD